MDRFRQAGFTLIELMIAVAIIGILSAIAYPSYTSYVTRANRATAASFLMQMANRQEQYQLDARRYAGGDGSNYTVGSAALTELKLSAPSELAGKYNFTAVCTSAVAVGNCEASAGPPTYVLSAQPLGGQASNDTKCGRLTLTQAGVKGENGTAASAAECW